MFWLIDRGHVTCFVLSATSVWYEVTLTHLFREQIYPTILFLPPRFRCRSSRLKLFTSKTTPCLTSTFLIGAQQNNGQRAQAWSHAQSPHHLYVDFIEFFWRIESLPDDPRFEAVDRKAILFLFFSPFFNFCINIIDIMLLWWFFGT